MDKDLILEHLANYKKETLKISEDGIFKRYNEPKAHILPEELKNKNIIDSEYFQMIINEIYDEKNEIKLHIYFNHLNSSQALCFNLFFPIFLENKFIFLLNKIINKDIGEKVEKYEFEYVEDNNENTNFDLYAKTNKTKFYFEVKYTEPKFGDEEADDKHTEKYNNIYEERLKIFKGVTPDIFFNNYQLFRNLIYNDGYNIFVFPAERADLRNTINHVIEKHCTKEQKAHIIILTIEEIVKTMLGSDNDKLINHYKKFSEKYFLKK